MRTEHIFIDNLKCSGCAASIKNGLLKIDHVESVNVDLETNRVDVNFDGSDDIFESIKKRLKSMGYAEKGTSTFVDKTKSYVSCAIGKLSD